MRNVRHLFVAILCVGMSISSCKCSGTQPGPPVEEKPKADIQAKPPAVATAPTTPTKAPPTAPQAAERPPLPDDFPGDIPTFEGATVERVQPLANDAKNVIFVSDKGVAEITTFYRKKLENTGWKMTQDSERPNHAFIAFKKGEMIANIQVVEDSRYPGKRLIAIMYEKEAPVPFDEF
jgi:hypothetical protein